jgi:putative transcriptional regulator
MLLLWKKNNKILTRIDINNNQVRIENFTDIDIFKAFGINEQPTVEDVYALIESRCMPRTRANLQEELVQLGLNEYNPLEIIKITKGKVTTDNFSLEIQYKDYGEER